MKRFFLFIVLLIIVAISAAYIYWQHNKKSIVKNAIQTTLTDKTDSLYYIHYDSSEIDEINGNAVFYNVVLQSDTLQQNMLKGNDTSLPKLLFNIHVKEIGILGVDIPGLLTKEVIAARTIYLKEPVLEIIQTDHNNKKIFTKEDTLELYKRIIGKYKSIHARSIDIINGNVKMIDPSGNTSADLVNINVSLNDFQVDSEHNYTNIISYFIKDVKVSVEKLTLPGEQAGTDLIFNNLIYDAARKSMSVQNIQQQSNNDTGTLMNVKSIIISGLNTDLLIEAHQLQASTINCNGGTITFIAKKDSTTKSKDPAIELSDDFFNHVEVGSIFINNTKLIFVNRQKPQQKPFELDSVKLDVYRKINIDQKSTLSYLINNAYWKLSANGFSFYTADGIYKVAIGAFVIDNALTSTISIKDIKLVPLYTEEQYRKKLTRQHDLYHFAFNNIVLKNMDIKKLIVNNEISIQDMFVQPVINIYNDRTLPPNDTIINLGKYPHQSLFKLKVPFYIANIHVVNGFVSYRERSSASKLVGNVYFQHINGLISNVTNIVQKINANPISKLVVTASFLNVGRFSTEWDFPLNTTNGSFTVSGELDSIDAMQLNDVTKPLALVAVNHGFVDKLVFGIKGNDDETTTDLQLLYHQLSITLLKKTGDDWQLKKKNVASFLANIIVKDDNPKGNETREISALSMTRNIHQAFFGVLWASIFNGIKKTVLGKIEN